MSEFNLLLPVHFQLNDIEKGGATVFPDLGATVWPEKVLYYTVYMYNGLHKLFSKRISVKLADHIMTLLK